MVPLITLLIGAILLSIATFNSGFSAAHPRPNTMSYLLDAVGAASQYENLGRASWVSSDRHLDPWKAQIMGANAQQQQVETEFGIDQLSIRTNEAGRLHLGFTRD
jgi:ribosomal protein S11